ncbi:hypothetical protein [Achromobacter insolitus]|uniref:hypothetical protein n=1 Tax=Achromobacter insolitus TaxID=217204 RepID=UPI001EEDFA8E|nr:hypothetical protein [Achromobacter insolitus]
MSRLALLAITYAAFAGAAHVAYAGACYAISDADARTHCLAKAHNDPARCYSIQAPDKRAACLAEVRGKRVQS